MKPNYKVLRPDFAPTFEKTPQGQTVFRVHRWVELGTAVDMADAKRLHPTPVLEAL